MISIIIPVYNASKTLYACLQSIFNLDHNNYEVIVVDDCSADNSIMIAKSFKVRILNLDKNYGQAICRNKGAEIANGSILVFVDSDCEVPKDWLKKFELIFKKEDVIAISGPYSIFIKKNLISVFQHYNTQYIQNDIPKYTESCTSSNLACKRDFFFKVKGFPNKRINEDGEFASNLSKMGKIYWQKDNGVAHNYKDTLKSYMKQQKSWAMGVLYSYLEKPNMLFEKGGFSKSKIASQLIVCLFFLFSFLLLLFNLYFLVFLLFFFVILIIINLRFLIYLKRKTNPMFLFIFIPLIFLRDIAWIYGSIIGIITYKQLIMTFYLKLKKLRRYKHDKKRI